MPDPPPPLPQTSNGLATCSLVCGICGFLTGPLTGIPAIITGHLAHGKIRKSGGVTRGAAAATTGIVLGWVTTVLITLGAVMVALAVPQIQKALERAALANNINSARQVKYVLDSYATDHDGHYPPDLATLATGTHSSAAYSIESHRYIDPKSNTAKDWIYFPGQTQTSPPTNIILASPDTVDVRGGARIVLRIDGSTRVMPERDYQRQLRHQGASP